MRRAYRSGTPAIGVGAGNVPVIVDETADLADAARKICASKTFDNATSCSSENSVTIVDAVYDAAIAALERRRRLSGDAGRAAKIQRGAVVGRPSQPQPDRPGRRRARARGFGLPEAAQKAKFFMVEDTGVGRDHPFSGEKLASC